MKRALSLLLTAALLITVFTVSAVPQSVAEDTTKDVFVVDGILDDKYIKTDKAGNQYYWHLSSDSESYETVHALLPLYPTEDGNTCEADVYTAYDQDYIYVYVKVTDPIIQQWDYQHWDHGGWGDCVSIWMDPDPSTQGMMPDGVTDDPLTENWEYFYCNCASPNQADNHVRLHGYDYSGISTYNGWNVNSNGFLIEDYNDYMKPWFTDVHNYCPFRFDGGYGVEARYARVATEKNYQFNISVGNSAYKSDGSYTLSFGVAWWLSYSGCKQIPYNFDNYPFTGEQQNFLLGDVNFDGKINTTDALLALRIAVHKLTPTAEQQTAADFDKNGTVNTTDALLILRAAVKK